MIASETASRHQPMNWRDSIWVQTSVSQWAFPKREVTQRLVPYSENKVYVSNPRRFVFERPQVVFYCNFSCSRHVSKSANLIGRIVFDAVRQTKKTNPRRLLKNDAFMRGVFHVGVHTHIGALCLVTRR